jgi:single-stranded DNA-binding protein
MSRIIAEFSGKVVAEPESKEVGGAPLLQFPVYVNRTKKNRDTGEYEPTGDTSKIRVGLWRDLASEDIRKGDIVEVKASIYEREYETNDGRTGRSLETDFVDSIVVKWRAPEESGQAGF